MVNNLARFQSRLSSIEVELLGWQSTHCHKIFTGRQNRLVFQNNHSAIVHCNTAVADVTHIIKRQCVLQSVTKCVLHCNVTKSNISSVLRTMSNVFLRLRSKRALIVLMINRFLFQGINIFHVYLRLVFFVVYCAIQLFHDKF